MSIMSYDYAVNPYALTPMIIDVIALGEQYGIPTRNSGDSKFSFLNGAFENGYYKTIVDSSGVDIVDLSDQNNDMYVVLGKSIGASYDVGMVTTLPGWTNIHSGVAPSTLTWLYGDFENAMGGSGRDMLVGNRLNNRLIGGGGNDSLTGGAGNDSLTGGAGNDTFNVDAGTDAITDLSGLDVLVISSGATANATVSAAWTATSASSNSGTANIATSGLAVNLAAVSGGSAGFRVTNGGAATTLTGSALADTVIGGGGNDKLVGGGGDDSLTGGAGADTIIGGAGNDSIDLTESSSAADVVVFAGGSTGAAGSLTRVASLGLDTISGFNPGTASTAVDRLQCSAADFGIAAATTVVKGGGNVDGNFYIVTAAPTGTGVDLNGSASGTGPAIVFVGAATGTAGVRVYFTTNEQSFSTTTAVQIATLVGINTATLDSTDLAFVP